MKKRVVSVIIVCVLALLVLAGCGNQKAMKEQISGIMREYGITEYEVKMAKNSNIVIECESFEGLNARVKRNLVVAILDDDTAREICGSGTFYPDLEIHIDEDTYYFYDIYRLNGKGPFGLKKESSGKIELVYDDGGIPW